jgi:acyl-CoA thioesterase
VHAIKKSKKKKKNKKSSQIFKNPKHKIDFRPTSTHQLFESRKAACRTSVWIPHKIRARA